MCIIIIIIIPNYQIVGVSDLITNNLSVDQGQSWFGYEWKDVLLQTPSFDWDDETCAVLL